MAITVPVQGQSDWAVTLNTALTQLENEKFPTPVSPPSVTGSRGGNAALASLLTALASLGLITNNTTA
jgi:hypothetical protein